MVLPPPHHPDFNPLFQTGFESTVDASWSLLARQQEGHLLCRARAVHAGHLSSEPAQCGELVPGSTPFHIGHRRKGGGGFVLGLREAAHSTCHKRTP